MQKSAIFILAIVVIIIGLFFAARRQKRQASLPVTPEAATQTTPTTPSTAPEIISPEEFPAAKVPLQPIRDAITTTLMQVSLDFAERYGNSVPGGSWLERFSNYLTPELKSKLENTLAPQDQSVQAVAAKPTALAVSSGRATFAVEVLRTVKDKTAPATLIVSLEKRSDTWLVSAVSWK